MDKNNQELSGLNFLFIFTGWLLLLAVGYLLIGIFGYHDFEFVGTWYSILIPLKSRLLSLFVNSDGWNLLILTVLLTLGVVVYAINDFVLRKAGSRYIKSKPKNYYYQGGFWMGRQMINLVISSVEFLIFCFIVNIFVAAPYLESPDNLTGKKDVLLLGTSKFLKNSNTINVYYQQRISCVVDLYNRGLVKQIILSGDTDPQTGYNEPADMSADLIGLGVKKSTLQIDDHGHRTFDSIIRYLAREDSDTVIIVSQLFHLQRALYLARQVGARAIGIPADGSMTQSMLQREVFAKCKVLLDLYVFNTQAYGLRPENRRSVSLTHSTDVVLLLLVSSFVFIAGIAFRRVLYF